MLAFVSGSDAVILLIAGYCAVILLVRLMRKRRDELVRELQHEVNLEQLRQRAERRRERKRQLRERQIQSQMGSPRQAAPRP